MKHENATETRRPATRTSAERERRQARAEAEARARRYEALWRVISPPGLSGATEAASLDLGTSSSPHDSQGATVQPICPELDAHLAERAAADREALLADDGAWAAPAIPRECRPTRRPPAGGAGLRFPAPSSAPPRLWCGCYGADPACERCQEIALAGERWAATVARCGGTPR